MCNNVGLFGSRQVCFFCHFQVMQYIKSDHWKTGFWSSRIFQKVFIHCQTSGSLGTIKVVLQPTWMLGKMLVKQLGRERAGSIKLIRCFGTIFKSLESQWIWMSNLKIRINLPFLGKNNLAFVYYAFFVSFFLKMKRMTPSFIFKLSVAPWEVFPPPWNSACRWYGQRASWDCSWLGAESWAQQTFSIKPVYSGPTVGKAANCSFVGTGEFTIGCLFLDGHSKEAKRPLSP